VLGKRLKPLEAEPEPAELDDTIYELKDGLRFVKPYEHQFIAFAKRRWCGERMIDVFAKEFKAYSQDYYTTAVEHGKITINGKTVALDYKLKDGDKIVHRTTRRETPVICDLPTVLVDNDNFVAVNKPGSIPVHPCGNFKENSLLNLLERCLKFKGLKSVHRLDRQTSGIVFFAKNNVTSNEFREALINDEVSKIYYARVKGNFKSICDEKGEVTCDHHIYCESHIDAIMTCCKQEDIPFEQTGKAKDAFTRF
jgi:23S rRNA-/tRNA-specific pseudouridylate synthase